MVTSEIERVLQCLKVLADETRLKVLGLLADRERSVGELAELLALKEPTISHHLGKLREAGLVAMRPEGTLRFYSLDSKTLQQLSRDLFTPEKVASLAGQVELDSWERKVLTTYLQGKTLTKIPDTRKKRAVILRWLAGQFEEDKPYPEREVNALIKQYHPDCATLRRELVGARLLQREKGVYWRLRKAA
jgi:hypothetical protein